MLRGQQQITGANAHAQTRTNIGANQRRFQLDHTAPQAASHRPAIFVQRQHGGVENVFES